MPAPDIPVTIRICCFSLFLAAEFMPQSPGDVCMVSNEVNSASGLDEICSHLDYYSNPINNKLTRFIFFVTVQIAPKIRQFKAQNVSLHV
jgi:hypothetical protein